MSTSAGDAFTLENSMIKEDTFPDFTSKNWSYQNDQNQSNYSTKQLQFDLSGFYNSQRFINLSEMFLVIPLVTVLSADNLAQLDTANSSTCAIGTLDGLGPQVPASGIATPNNLYSVGFKSGYWNLIYSMSVTVDGQDVIQLTPNINYYCSFMANTKWSRSDIQKHGPTCGFLPDDELSWGINACQAANANGYGCYNNTIPGMNNYPGRSAIPISGWTANTTSSLLPSIGSGGSIPENKQYGGLNTFSGAHFNKALFERMLKTSYYVSPGTVQNGIPSVGVPHDPKWVMAAGNGGDFITSMLQDGGYVLSTTASASAPSSGDPSCNQSGRYWLTTAIIRFKDICQMFEKLPLSRGLYIRLTINLNIGHLSVYQPNYQFPGIAPASSGDLKYMGFASGANAAAYQVEAGAANATIKIDNYAMESLATVVPAYIPCASPALQTLAATGSQNNVQNGAVDIGSMTINGRTPYFGYGYIYDNSFQGTCPIMLAKAVSSVYTNYFLTPVAPTGSVGTGMIGSLGQVIETDVEPGLNCGMYSQYRNALHLSISVCKPESSYHPRIASLLANISTGLSSTRVYAPSIELEPRKALRYLEEHKIQQIVYNDVLALTYPNVAAGQTINYLASTGIANAKRVIILPFYHNDTTPSSIIVSTSAQTVGVAAPAYYNNSCSVIPFQPISPFDTAPATTAPGAFLRAFQIQLANANIFQRQMDYNFEQFIEELSECNAINGGLDTGLTSGIIDFRKWENNYRYYVANLSRRLAGDNTPKSITIQAINDTIYQMDLYIFVEYERKFSLNVETGHISA